MVTAPLFVTKKCLSNQIWRQKRIFFFEVKFDFFSEGIKKKKNEEDRRINNKKNIIQNYHTVTYFLEI